MKNIFKTDSDTFLKVALLISSIIAIILWVTAAILAFRYKVDEYTSITIVMLGLVPYIASLLIYSIKSLKELLKTL